jgi:SAM-dependent methyltransferase
VNIKAFSLKSLLSDLKALYGKQAFMPGWAAIFLNPFYFARKGLFSSIRELAPRIQGRTLDIGCGIKPYQNLFYSTEYVGLEIDTQENHKHKSADYYYDGHRFPFENEYFDAAVSSQVFEHVFNPDEFLSEAHRVLKEDGVLLLTVPFIWDEHEPPFDFGRYSSFGIRHLLEKNGFTVLLQRKSTDGVRVIFQLFNVYLYKRTVTRSSLLNAVFTLFLMAPFNILGEILGRLLPKNPDLYLDNIVLARKA